MSTVDPTAKFDHSRASEYETQSRIALAGYDACHELSACLLSASLGSEERHVLVAGAGGTGQEFLVMGKLEPQWTFVAADPSLPMLEQAMERVEGAGLSNRVERFHGAVESLPTTRKFDAATLIGVLHHIPSDDGKDMVLRELAERLHPGAPLVVACNRCAYESQPLFLEAWARRWRMAGASEEEVTAKLAKIRLGAVPPASEAAVETKLAAAGFDGPLRFFSSLFWSAWIAFRSAQSI
jgi:tRNA (cmo5U34)-methyltransferase